MLNLLSCEQHTSDWLTNKLGLWIRPQTDLCSWNIINQHAFEICPIPLGQMTICKLSTAHSHLWMRVYVRVIIVKWKSIAPNILESTQRGSSPFDLRHPSRRQHAVIILDNHACLPNTFNCAECKCQEGLDVNCILHKTEKKMEWDHICSLKENKN